MLCPKCKVEMRLASRLAATNEAGEIKVFLVQEFFCRDPRCENYKKGPVERVLHEQALTPLE